MAEKNVNVRLVATGGGQVRAELSNIGKTGDAALNGVGAAATTASNRLKVVENAAEKAGDGASAMGGGLRAASMQMSQMAQQTMATGNFLQSLAIQLPDLTLGFGPLGIAAGIAGGVLLTLIPSLLGTGDAAKEMQDKLDAAEKSTQAMVAALKLANTPVAILRQQYRGLADEIQRATGIAAGFAADQARRDVLGAARGLGDTVGDINPVRTPGLSDPEWAAVQASIMDDLREKTGATVDQVDLLRMALTRTGSSNSLDAVVKDGENLLSVIDQIYKNADAEQQQYLRDWAANVSAVVQVARDQIDAEIAERQRLADTYDKTGTQIVQLADDLESAEAERAKAVAAGLKDEVALWDRVIAKIQEATLEAKSAAGEFAVAFARGNDGFSTMFDKMRLGGLPYQQDVDIGAAASKGILDLIAKVEGTDKGRGYNETLGYGAYTGGPVNLINMTLREVLALQRQMLAHPDNTYNSSAVGRYQIVGTTLGGEGLTGQGGLIKTLGLDLDQLFDEQMQDRLAAQLVRETAARGTQKDWYNQWQGLEAKRVDLSTINNAMGVKSVGLDPAVEAARKKENDELQRGLDLRADFMVALQDQANAAALEAQVAGQSVYEQVRLRTEMTLTQQARAKGIDLNEQIAGSEKTYGQAIKETAASMAASAQEQAAQEGRFKAAEDAAKRAADTMRKFQDDLKQGFRSAFQSVIDGTESVADAFRNMIADMLMQRAMLGFDNLIDGLLGAAFGGGDPLAAALTGAGVCGVQSSGNWFSRAASAVTQQAVQVTVGVDQRTGNLTAFTDQRVAAGMRQADRAMPSRVADINRDRLKR